MTQQEVELIEAFRNVSDQCKKVTLMFLQSQSMQYDDSEDQELSIG